MRHARHGHPERVEYVRRPQRRKVNNMLSLIAQASVRTWSFGEMAIGIVILIAVLAVVWIFVKQSGVPIPQWLIHVAWIVVAAFVCIIAIRLLLSM